MTDSLELAPVERFTCVAKVRSMKDKAGRFAYYDEPQEWYLGYAAEEVSMFFPNEASQYAFTSLRACCMARDSAFNKDELGVIEWTITRVRTRTIIETEDVT